MSEDAWATRLSNIRAVADAHRATDEAGIHERMGQTLVWTQGVERTLRFVLTFVIQKDGELTLEKLKAQTAAERKKTIGYFLDQMRRRVSVHSAVDQHLSAFLTMRNQFVHDVEGVAGWDLETEEGLASANDFLSDLGGHAIWIHFWLAGIVRSWSVEIGHETGPEHQPTLEFLDRTFRPVAEFTLDGIPE